MSAATLDQVTDWRAAGACAGEDPDMFYTSDWRVAAEAKAVCAGCPVQDACLAFALAARVPAGIWGGTSGTERRQMRRPAPAPLCRKKLHALTAASRRTDGRCAQCARDGEHRRKAAS
jgi:WhiB family redox-sensing transcriptional regulator